MGRIREERDRSKKKITPTKDIDRSHEGTLYGSKSILPPGIDKKESHKAQKLYRNRKFILPVSEIGGFIMDFLIVIIKYNNI